jgi:ESS family glutamate:Na+ symporter
LFLGKYLNHKIGFLREFNIPEPVTGGLLISVLLGIVHYVADFSFEFALATRDNLLIIFFTTIGLSSKIRTLLRGGRQLLVLLLVAVGYLFVQNFTGIGVAAITGQDLAAGVLGGSVSLSGGHGTVIAWIPIFARDYDIANAAEIGVACATFGLILGGIIGGPLAKFLISRHQLHAPKHGDVTVGIPYEQEALRKIDYESMLQAILTFSIAIGIGIHLDLALDRSGVQLPTFVMSGR